jgi:hypothetical protein
MTTIKHRSAGVAVPLGGRRVCTHVRQRAVGLAATFFTGCARPEAAESCALHPEVPDQPSQAA